MIRGIRKLNQSQSQTNNQKIKLKNSIAKKILFIT